MQLAHLGTEHTPCKQRSSKRSHASFFGPRPAPACALQVPLKTQGLVGAPKPPIPHLAVGSTHLQARSDSAYGCLGATQFK